MNVKYYLETNQIKVDAAYHPVTNQIKVKMKYYPDKESKEERMWNTT